jgi:beta-galactosidase
MSNSTVWINGQKVGGRPYGYESFALDLTPYLKFGEENVLAVRLAPEDQSSRWYPGAGIYRNVWLNVTGAVRVAQWGTYITTPAVTDAKATVVIRTEVENKGAAEARVTLETAILDAAGKQAGRATNDVTIPAGGKQSVEAKIDVANPHRWDLDTPYLYSAASTIRQGASQSDRYVTPFGIRTIEYSRDKGFLLNGRPAALQRRLHAPRPGSAGRRHQSPRAGAAVGDHEAMGVNAIRTSHNPPAPELLELTDRMGLLVMDEAFDMWEIPKVRNGLSKYWKEWYETDLREFIRRDRNHPSVVMWSIGNEIPEQGRPDGGRLAQKLTDIVHEEDRTRPTTAAFNNDTGAIKNELASAVDVPGFNYKPTRYAEILKDHPNWIIYGSETASAVSSRGVYHLPIEKYQKHPSLQLTSYDVIAPPWAYIPDVEFDAQEKNPNVLGEFVWTGFDYLGEPTPYFNGPGQNDADWPSRSSYFGIVDLAGFPKDRFYLYQSHWTTKPMVHLLPHWNWAGMEGKPIPVMCYTNAEEVELFLNGSSPRIQRTGATDREIARRRDRPHPGHGRQRGHGAGRCHDFRHYSTLSRTNTIAPCGELPYSGASARGTALNAYWAPTPNFARPASGKSRMAPSDSLPTVYAGPCGPAAAISSSLSTRSPRTKPVQNALTLSADSIAYASSQPDSDERRPQASVADHQNAPCNGRV